MNRELIVTLLRKDIQELTMITEGFMEMNEYPKAIIMLAQKKATDIQDYIFQLSELKSEDVIPELVPEPVIEPSAPIEFSLVPSVVEENLAEEVLEEHVPEISQSEEITESATIETIVEAEPIVLPIEDLPIVIDHSEEINAEPEPVVAIVPIVEEEVPQKAVAIELPVVELSVLSRNEQLAKTQDNSLGAVLANKKITDIKQAMSIGDRFRFQRELFGGNGEDMNKTIAYINQLATYTEVESFLKSKYKWADENETAEDFFQLVRRKF